MALQATTRRTSSACNQKCARITGSNENNPRRILACEKASDTGVLFRLRKQNMQNLSLRHASHRLLLKHDEAVLGMLIRKDAQARVSMICRTGHQEVIGRLTSQKPFASIA